MPYHLTKCCFYVFVLAYLAYAQDCTYECELCKADSGEYYDYDNGTCKRNNEKLRYFMLGAGYCSGTSNIIHDNDTCAELRSIADGTRQPRVGHFFKASNVEVTWDPNSTGCRVWGRGPAWSMVNSGIKFSARICLHSWNIEKCLMSLGMGLLLGIVLACLGTGCGKKDHKKYDRDVQGTAKDFLPGAKLMSADALIRGGGARKKVLAFRVFQVIANAWFPMVLLIYLNPLQFLALYLLLYVLPAYSVAGSHVFLEPIYLLTPPDVSLFGIDGKQPNYTISFLYSGVRPFLVFGLVEIIEVILAALIPDENQAAVSFNVSGFLRSAMMEGYGPLVVDFVMLGTLIGVIMHFITSLDLVWNAWRDPNFTGGIGLNRDDSKAQDVHDLRKEIQALALDLKSADDEDEVQERQQDLNDYAKTAFTKQEGSGTGCFSAKEIEVTFTTKLNVLVALVLALVDLGAYAYKVYVFLRGGRYFLAGIIMTALSESFAVLAIAGTLRRARKALQMSISSGVPTVDFLALCQWDDDIAGVPYLLTTIYGLPLAGIHNLFGTISGIFFICTGTRAMAKFIMNAVDFDMFDIPDDRKIGDSDEEYHDFLAYEEEVAEEGEDSE